MKYAVQRPQYLRLTKIAVDGIWHCIIIDHPQSAFASVQPELAKIGLSFPVMNESTLEGRVSTPLKLAGTLSVAI